MMKVLNLSMHFDVTENQNQAARTLTRMSCRDYITEVIDMY